VVAVRAAGPDGSDAIPRRLERGRLSVVIVIDGVPVSDLPAGARLRLGPTAVVELVGESDSVVSSRPFGTGGLLEIGSRAPVPAQVVDPGEVTLGDAVALETVTIPVTDMLDLHSFRPEETQQVVLAYLAEARRAGLKEVRIVHGRGRGVQRALVRRVLDGMPDVAEFSDAPPMRGGWGATLVRLHRTEESRTR
jgi:hypothetical protein